MCNSKIPHNTSTHVNFYDVNLGDIIKAISHQFDFDDINNEPYNFDPAVKANSTDNSVNNGMILTRIYKSDKVSSKDIRKALSSTNIYSTQKLKDLTIDGKMYHQVNNYLIYTENHNHTHCQLFVDWDVDGGVDSDYIIFINTYQQLHVKNWGINNNDIKSVPIDTIGALDQSQIGPVIIITHQYE